MELMTKEIRAEFKRVGDQEEKKPADVICVVKYFDPTGSWTWWATEILLDEGQDVLTIPEDEIIFFGLVDGFELEWGTFSLAELKEVRGALGIGIERDLYGGYPKKMGEIQTLKGRL
jgi:hypothetical protein